MHLEKANDYENFFYNAGLYLGDHFGNKSMAFRRKAIDNFMAFVSAYGGVDRFSSSKDAVRYFLRKTKGGTRVFSKH